MIEKTNLKNHEKVHELRKHHQSIFDSLGVQGALYFPKMFYRPSGKEELYVSFFKSELQRGQDLYTEMVDRDFTSEDQSRQLFRWKYNPQWADDYEPTESTPVRYLVPVSELDKVPIIHVPLGKGILRDAEETSQDCISDDCNIDQMSMRDLLAIIQGVPISSKKWLNDAIAECRRVNR